jgi:hypothetical protein
MAIAATKVNVTLADFRMIKLITLFLTVREKFASGRKIAVNGLKTARAIE